MAIRVAVIGAGAAGLAAAWTLRQAKHQVVIYEKRAVAGGLLRTAERGGVLADQAVQLLSASYSELFRVAREAGVAGRLAPASGHDALWRRGRAHGITYGSVASMLASGALPTMLKLRLGAKYVPFLGTRASKLDVNDLARTGVAEDRESIAAWGGRELGEDFVEYLAYPLLAAYYGTPPEQVSAALYHGLARVGMDVHLHRMRGGAAAFAGALAKALTTAGVELHVDAEVHAVSVDGAGVRVRTSRGETAYDAAVIATPPAAAAALVEDERLRAWVSAVPTRPAVSLTFWLRRPVRAHSFGMSFPRHERPGDVIVAACIQGQKLEFAPGATGDAVVVFPAPAYLDRDPSDETLQQQVAAALEIALPGISKVIDAVEVTRLEGGYRVFPPGSIRRLAQEPPPVPVRLALAGDYLVAPMVEGAVRSGVAAGRRLSDLPLL